MKPRIAVLFGGASKDYTVSLRSAKSVVRNLNYKKYDVLPVGITRSGRWLCCPVEALLDDSAPWYENSDCCSAVISPDPEHNGLLKCEDGKMNLLRLDGIFSVLHGKYGECGKVQGLMKLSGVPFAGSGIEGAVNCSDRSLFHLVLNSAGIKTADYLTFERELLDLDSFSAEKELSGIGYPLIIKAASCSSSIGAHIVASAEEFSHAAKIAFSHHHKILAETLPETGRELECVVYGSNYSRKVSRIGEIKKVDSGFKYVKSTGNFIAASLTAEEQKLVTETALKAAATLLCKGFVRLSFALEGGEIYCRHASNIPGFSEGSALSRLAEFDGEKLSDVLNEILEPVVG
ncbi:D-alanine--(R)-lactate ligase VanI [Clostridia bacterium]|nr:D-alanine--(R)-lactate ligase VanI [Clostridia bacterium]